MFTRKFFIDTIPTRRILQVRSVEKCYFRKDYNIYYYKIEDHNSNTVKCGLRLESQWDTDVEFDLNLYNFFAKECDVRLKKMVSVLQLEEDRLQPITVIEIHQYDGLHLTIVEINFETKELADAFVPPKWFQEEITDNTDYNDFCIAYGVNATMTEISKTESEAAFTEEDIRVEAARSELERAIRLGSFEERLQRVKAARHKNA